MSRIDAIPAPALQVQGLCKAFAGQPAVQGLDLALAPGSMTVLLGPAGAGKTTTLRLIAGLETADAGRVLLGGRDMAGLEPRARDIAMIFDNLALYPNRTGFENMAHPLRIRRLPEAMIRDRVTALAAVLQIPHVLSRLPRTMSGGERQRVALGRALVREPALFLLDEPLSSLDAKLRIELRAELRRLQRDEGHSFFLATPDFAEAMAIADTIVVLRAGRIVQVGPPQQVYDAPADRETARFVGAPEINLLPADSRDGHLSLAGAVIDAPGLPVEGRFEAGLRPEDLHLTAPGAGHLDGRIADLEPLGQTTAVDLDAGGARLRLTLPTARATTLAVGQISGIRAALGRMHCFDMKTGLRIAR